MTATKSLWDTINDLIAGGLGNTSSILTNPSSPILEQQRFALQQHQLMTAQKEVWGILQGWPSPIKEPSVREIMLDAADRAAREEWSREWVYYAF